MPTTFIKNGQLVTEKGTDRTDILIEDGIVTHTASRLPNNADEIIDASGLLIFPGLIDCHVHFREPGMVEAEDMESGSAAALAGGVTTVCDMPNTEPPTCTREALKNKLEHAKRIKGCDIRLFFGIANRDHLEELSNVDRDDICGVKLYFGQSTGNLKVEDPTSPSGLRGARGVEEEVFRLCAKRDIPLVCHCEDEETIQKNIRLAPLHTDIRLHSDIRSVEAAVKATARAIGLAKKYGTQLHIAHVSTADELTLIQQAKADNLRVTCEVAPHHLFLSVDDYETLGALAKINPPLRTNDHCEALWRGILDGTVDCIASDHAPHTLESKRVEHALEAPSGVPGVETMVPLLLSVASGHWPHPSSSPPSIPVFRYSGILRLCFTNPNRIFRLGKSGIAVGKPADLILIDPNASWIIRGKELHSRCGWTPYEGWGVRGSVVRVIRR